MACLRPISTESNKSLDGKGQKSIIEIYTDWANHYLDKTKGKRRITNLQTELSDGVVLCEVIEAVTQQKVPDVNKKPKNNTIVITNIQACLNFLRGKGVSVDDIQPEDIRDGNLKAILGLFFQLSRYKQQQKQQLGGGRTSIPSSPAKTGGSGIPVPGQHQVMASPKRSLIPGSKINGNHNGSGIARPNGVNHSAFGDVDRPPSGRHSSKLSMVGGGGQRNGIDAKQGSMLDRFKISGRSSITQPSKPGLGKRTSSSSGFSSARSDRSESSISLSSDTNFPSPSALRRIKEAQESIPASEQQHSPASHRRGLQSGSGIRSRFASGNKEKSSSPKRSPRLGRHNSGIAGPGGGNTVTEIKDYGPIDDSGGRLGAKPEKYPPHAYSRKLVISLRTFDSRAISKSHSGIAFKHTNISSSPQHHSRTTAQDSSTTAQQQLTRSNSSKVPTPASSCGSGISKIAKVDRGATAAATAAGSVSSSSCSKKQPPAPPVRTNSIPYQNNLSGKCDGNEKSDDTESISSAHSKSCSLPRQTRTLSPSPNVAVVSPMPSANRRDKKYNLNGDDKLIREDDLKKKLQGNGLRGKLENSGEDGGGGGVPPMAPLELFRTRKVGGAGDKPTGNGSEDIHSLVSGDAGYVSDSDVIRNRNKIDSGYVSEGGAEFLHRGGVGRNGSRGNKTAELNDGYTSEGGADFYSRRVEQRLAYEKQRAEAETQHKLYLELSGKAAADDCDSVPGVANGASQVYKVVGGRRNVPKSDSGIQTELRGGKSSLETGTDSNGRVILPGRMENEDLSAAMERSRMLLTSQELAMQEYLKRQKREADKHIRNSPLNSRRNNTNMNTVPGRNGGMMSMPGTPTGFRRNSPANGRQEEGSRFVRGGSLERKVTLPNMEHKQSVYNNSTVSDSEYGTYKSNSKENNSRSLPKGTSSLNYGLLVGQIQQKRQQKAARKDGNWSDCNYSTYTEIMSQKIGNSAAANSGPFGTQQQTTHYGWLQPAQTYSGWNSAASAASETRGSNESLNSISSSIRNARSLSLTRANVMAHQMKVDENYGKVGQTPPRGLPRTGYNEDTEYYGVPILSSTPLASRFNSQPTSPVYGDRSLVLDLCASNLTGNTPRYSSLPPNVGANKQQRQRTSSTNKSFVPAGSRENLNGSHLSLVSNESVYGTQEERTNADISKLKRELEEEQSKVFCLTNQLNTNAHVVSAFEQSLANMTSRLQEITRTAEKKDAELAELRRTIEVFRQSGVDAGLIKGIKTGDEVAGYDLTRQMSTDSVSSVLSTGEDDGKKSLTPKRSGWLRSSFSKAFKSKVKSKGTPTSDVEDSPGCRGEPLSLDLPSHSTENLLADSNPQISKSSTDLRSDTNPVEDVKVLDELKRQLIEKDTLLTETRLEALSSAHQLESLKDTVTKMKSELINLRQDNEKLQSQVSHKSLGSSESSLNTTHDTDNITNSGCGERRVSLAVSEGSSCHMISGGPSTLDLSGTTDPSNQENKHLSVELELSESDGINSIRIGTIAASGKLSWELLDSLIERLFKEYIMRIDAVTHLGLGAESIHYYKVGEINRKVKDNNPELLPYGYLIGDVNNITIVLKNTSDGGGLDALALETLTPKSIIQRYLSMLQDHRRVILSGPSRSTGKSFLATKLAKLLIKINAKNNTQQLKLEHFELTKNNHENFTALIQKINSDTAEHSPDLPFVLILDNLHLEPQVDLVLSQNLNIGAESGPFIIGTMIQSSSNNSTNLQLKHNFRWILCANHIEPVRGLLSRYLKKNLLLQEAETRQFNPELAKVVDWVSKAALAINKFLETHCNPESTLSPITFMTCPMDANEARLWFTNLWNLTIVPHLLDAVTEGLQAFGRRAVWDSPLNSLQDNWPWTSQDFDNLVRILPEDVSFESYPAARPVSGHSGDNGLEDPLFNMLMTLQEAATNQTGPDL